MHCMIKKNNWHCFCCSIFSIKLLTMRIQISFNIICSSRLSISINTLKSRIDWFARNWHWLFFQISSSRIENDLIRINWLQSIKSFKSFTKTNTKSINCFSWTISKKQKKFSFKTMSWSNCEQSNCQMKMNLLSCSRWFFQTLSSRFWKKKLLRFISNSKSLWIRRMKTFVQSKKVSIALNLLKQSNWFFETRFSCNENEISWSSIVRFLIFAMLKKLFFFVIIQMFVM